MFWCEKIIKAIYCISEILLLTFSSGNRECSAALIVATRMESSKDFFFTYFRPGAEGSILAAETAQANGIELLEESTTSGNYPSKEDYVIKLSVIIGTYPKLNDPYLFYERFLITEIMLAFLILTFARVIFFLCLYFLSLVIKNN